MQTNTAQSQVVGKHEHTMKPSCFQGECKYFEKSKKKAKLMNTVKVYSEGRAGGLRASSLDFQPYDPELPGGPPWPLLPEELPIYPLYGQMPQTKQKNKTKTVVKSGFILPPGELGPRELQGARLAACNSLMADRH